MILSNTELFKALDEGRLVISPEPAPRLPQVGGGHCPFDTHSVDLTLGEEILVPREGSTMAIDLSQSGSVAETIRGNCAPLKISLAQPYRLLPNTFILANTRESISLPLQPEPNRSLAARIEGKSSRARFGLLVHFTAPTVHPNFKGTLTLEMINLSRWPFLLTPGMPIAQLIVEEVLGIPQRNDSQFQGQNTPAGA